MTLKNIISNQDSLTLIFNHFKRDFTMIFKPKCKICFDDLYKLALDIYAVPTESYFSSRQREYPDLISCNIILNTGRLVVLKSNDQEL